MVVTILTELSRLLEIRLKKQFPTLCGVLGCLRCWAGLLILVFAVKRTQLPQRNADLHSITAAVGRPLLTASLGVQSLQTMAPQRLLFQFRQSGAFPLIHVHFPPPPDMCDSVTSSVFRLEALSVIVSHWI
jgi:hypothetical protein